MNIKPSQNTKLYGMNSYFLEMTNLYKNNKMPNKILLSGKKGSGKATLTYHIINYILSADEDFKYNVEGLSISSENRSYKLLQNNSHPNFFLVDLIDDKKSIDIAQIRNMITYSNKSSFNDAPRFILIDNIENLNKNSINALLKIIEEPNTNIYFILIHNNEKKILPTLRSRCLTFKISFSFDETINISNSLLDNDVFNLINYNLLNPYNTVGDIINLINFGNEKKINLKECTVISLLNLLIDNSYYKKNKPIKEMMINFIELYFLKLYKISNSKKKFIKIYQNFIYRIYNVEKFNLDEESLFLEFKTKLSNG
tara:strand:- start:361 stop:1299 length:939 start_codon:yes stop_codon:yes gene_type:complete